MFCFLQKSHEEILFKTVQISRYAHVRILDLNPPFCSSFATEFKFPQMFTLKICTNTYKTDIQTQRRNVNHLPTAPCQYPFLGNTVLKRFQRVNPHFLHQCSRQNLFEYTYQDREVDHAGEGGCEEYRQQCMAVDYLSRQRGVPCRGRGV